jgi:hypothetical protein
MGPAPTRWRKPVVLGAIFLLYAPALLSFGVHVAEHAWPLGFSRLLPDQAWRIPFPLAWRLYWFADHCVMPTSCGIGLAFLASMRLQITLAARAGLGVVSALAYASMLGINAVLHSCWGEAPHAFWFAFWY